MGITGLLPFLDKAKTEINVRSLANKTVAIDTYCWLHKGAFGVGDKIARGERTDVHIKYCLKYVNMLLAHNIKPILVFDGRHLPAKAETEARRRERRKADKQRALELIRKGRHSEAGKYLRRCVDITHDMAHELMEHCRSINVDCIVAPYEADGQLAFLSKSGLADYVITEDSDLTLFGCSKILFKLDLTGACVLVESDKFPLAMNCPEDKFTMDKFRLMCVLSGCDYADSLPGIGLAKALKFVMMTEETNLWRALDKIPSYLNMRQLTVTDEYKESVMKALATFLHMVVYDPRQRKQVRLNEIEETGTEIQYCSNSGEIIDEETSLDLAIGNLNPFSNTRLSDWHPDKRHKRSTVDLKTVVLKVAKHPSIWEQDYRWSVALKKPDTSKTDTKKAAFDTTAVRRSKRSLPPANIEQSDEQDENTMSSGNGEDLLNEYANLAEPQQKRFKDDDVQTSDDASVLKSPPTPKRNPFKTTNPIVNELLSPTRISKENNSLVRNQSPVKRIDYNKLQKLSRFDRTTGSTNQHMLSQYFSGKSPTHQNTSESETPKLYFHEDTTNADEIVEEKCVKNEVEEECGKNKTPLEGSDPFTVLNKFMFTQSSRMESDDSAVCLTSQTSSTTVQSNCESNGEMDSAVESQIEISSESSNDAMADSDDKNDCIEAPIEISDEEMAVNRPKPKQTQSKAMDKKKTVSGSRKVGLRSSKASQSKLPPSSSVQMKLSMFGFQAKPRAT